MLLFGVTSVILALAINACRAEKQFNFIDDTLQDTYGKVIFCSVVFRHGDRTVNRLYPTDLYQADVWTEGLGQLTKIGKLREYKLGQWFRKRYEGLVQGRPYRHDLLQVDSSNLDRTLMSAQLFLAGFYPASKSEKWNDEEILSQWQPIPVHTIARSTDNVIALLKPCDRYDAEALFLSHSPEMKAYFEDHRSQIEYMAAHSGNEMSKDDIFGAFAQLWTLYDILFIEERNNLTLPSWTKQIYPQPLRNMAYFAFSTMVHTTTMQRLIGGPMLKEVIQDMTTKRENSQWTRLFHFYSGHDSNVMAVLSALGVYDGIAPPYCSSVVLELRQKNEQHYVTVLYRNSSEAPPRLLEIRGCTNPCSLDAFVEATKPVVPEDWDRECDVRMWERLSYASPSYIMSKLVGLMEAVIEFPVVYFL